MLGEVLECMACARPYRIIRPEYDFLRIEGLPLPRYCVDCRHNARIALRSTSKMHPRQCMCDNAAYANVNTHAHHGEGRCPNTFETSYSPDRPEIVYCEACYNAEVD